MANLYHFGVALVSLLSLNYRYAYHYLGFSQNIGHRSWNVDVIKLIGDLNAGIMASVPPWQQKPDTQNSYVLPPWGLTVKDFVVTRQMPLSSGEREILLSSPSTGSEQRLAISQSNSSSFQIHSLAFTKVFAAGDKISFANPGTRSLLQSFQVRFANNKLTEVILADGTKAEFLGKSLTVKSPSGQVIENFRLSDRTVPVKRETMMAGNQTKSILSNKQFGSKPLSAQASTDTQSQKNCEREVVSVANQISNPIDAWSREMVQSSSETTKAIGWAIGHSSEALKNSIALSDSVPNVSCRPPVQCEERKVSGGNEIRTDLFTIPQNKGGSKVSIRYDFYQIPDSVEMYYDGKRIFSVGPSSGQGSRAFDLPTSAQQVGITLRGNNDPNTQWWYEISCTAPVKDPCDEAAQDETVPSSLREARKRACRLRTEFVGWQDKLDACPCTKAEAERSGRFVESSWVNRWFVLPFYHPGAYTDFRSIASVVKGFASPKTANIIKPGQQCTYDRKGNLITHGAAAGTPDAFSPGVTYPFQGWVSNNSHTYWDVTPSDSMTWEEYHQTWMPNNGNRCRANDGIEEEIPLGPPPVPKPVPVPNPPSMVQPKPSQAPTPAPKPVPAPPWDNRRSLFGK